MSTIRSRWCCGFLVLLSIMYEHCASSGRVNLPNFNIASGEFLLSLCFNQCHQVLFVQSTWRNVMTLRGGEGQHCFHLLTQWCAAATGISGLWTSSWWSRGVGLLRSTTLCCNCKQQRNGLLHKTQLYCYFQNQHDASWRFWPSHSVFYVMHLYEVHHSGILYWLVPLHCCAVAQSHHFVTFRTIFSSAERSRDAEKASNKKCADGERASPGDTVWGVWETPVLQYQRPAENHAAAHGETQRAQDF